MSLRPIRSLQVAPTVAGLAGLLAVGGCDLPTGTPVVESRWIVPGLETAVAVRDLLPEGITTTPDGREFVVSMEPLTATTSLGQLCGACRDAEGLTVPKPAFDATFVGGSALPADVEGARLATSTIDLRASHDFSFDPLRPGGGARGTMVLSVRTNGTLLAVDTVRGSRTAFPPGSTLTRTLTLPAGAEVASSMVVETRLISPDGDPITPRPSNRLTVTGIAEVRVASATVDVTGRSVPLDETALDVEGVDRGVVDRVEQGAFLLDVANPWGVGLDMTLTVHGGEEGPITRRVRVPATPRSTLEVALGGAELRSFLGRGGIVVTGSGTVPPSSDAVVLTPTQTASIEADLALTLRVGG